MASPEDCHTFASGAQIRLVRGDITLAEVDAIVNAANAQLAHGGGVAAAIARRGGPVIDKTSREWVRQHGPVTFERPALTPAGALPCRFVIHAVGPVWGEGDEDNKLAGAVTSALRLASEHQLSSLAMPAISTGIFGFPKERAAPIVFAAVAAFFEAHPGSTLRRVDVMLFDEPTFEAFTHAFHERWRV